MSHACRSFVRPIRSIPLATLAVALCASATSAAPQVWSEQVGSSAFDTVRGVTPDGAGGTFECGVTSGDLGGPLVGATDAFLTRRMADGSVLWSSKVATPQMDQGISVASDGAGGVFLTGNLRGELDVHFSDKFDAFVARFDAAGNQLWLRSLAIAAYEEVSSCAPDGAGGVFVAGRSFADPTAAAFQKGDVWLARVDAGGNTLWLDQFGTSETEFVTRVESDGAGGALLCGGTYGDLAGPLFGAYDAWAARYDAAGNQQSLFQFSAVTSQNLPTGIVPDGAGGAYVCWSASSWPIVTHFDASWGLIWQYAIAASGAVTDLAPDGAGGLYVLGSTYGEALATNAGNSDIWIRHLDSNGILQQSMQFGSKGYDHGVELAVVGSGVVACGYSWGPGGLFGPLGNSFKGWVGRFEDCDFDTTAKYCTSNANSTGEPALIGRLGSTHVDNNDLALFAKGLPVFETGVFLLATGTNNLPFGNGVLCVGGAVQRLGSVSTSAGFATLPLDFTNPNSPASQITPGSTWNFQFWYRDTAGGGAGFNLSNGLSANFCP